LQWYLSGIDRGNNSCRLHNFSVFTKIDYLFNHSTCKNIAGFITDIFILFNINAKGCKPLICRYQNYNNVALTGRNRAVCPPPDRPRGRLGGGPAAVDRPHAQLPARPLTGSVTGDDDRRQRAK